MIYKTLGDLITMLDEELDLTGETSITRTEKVNYINKGIKEAVAEVLKLGIEDLYFLASQPLNMVEGTAVYGLPVNIYANRIRRIMYKNGSRFYEILRMRKRFNLSIEEQIAEIEQYGNTRDYQYIVKNDSVDFGNEIKIYPTPRETLTIEDAIWYDRSPIELSQDDDVVEVPEFYPFVIQFAKVKCMAKTLYGEPPQYEVAERERQRALMVDTLEDMVPDGHTEISPDTRFYQDFDVDNYRSR